MPQDRLFLETESLVVRWQRGDRPAFEQLVALRERSLFYYLRRLAPSEADAWELVRAAPVVIRRASGRFSALMIHENLSASIEGLSSRIIAIRDSL